MFIVSYLEFKYCFNKKMLGFPTLRVVSDNDLDLIVKYYMRVKIINKFQVHIKITSEKTKFRKTRHLCTK